MGGWEGALFELNCTRVCNWTASPSCEVRF